MSFCTNYVYFISSQIGSIFNCNREGADLDECTDALNVHQNVNLWWFLPALMVVFVPLVWIRKMEKLAFTHIIGDVIIITVVSVAFGYAGH
jgi:amino acid permease